MELNELTITQAAEGLRKKKFSSVELTKACLARINERNKDINAFITVADESAMEEAKKADEMIAKGEGRMLTGIPFAVKDAICTADVRSTGAAKILDNYLPPYDATVIKKIREQGGVLLGKNNCDTFGHGASNENSMYGPVKNPHDLTKVAGGSSGGSAAAVADNMCIYAIAEDTGGSIRYPASFCGVVGLRPSYGRNSRYGVMPMASSLDTVGPITKTVADTALVMEVVAGRDERDATTVSDNIPKYSEEITKLGNKEIQKLRIGVPREYFDVAGMNSEVRAITEEAIKRFKSLGGKIEEVSLPHTKYAIAAYYIIVPSEDSSNLARLDGIRYGVRAEAGSLYDVYARSRAWGFPEEVKRRILIGTYALSAGYYDAYYKKAARVRTLIKQDFDQVFDKVDVLISPTSPFPPFGMGEKAADPLAMYLTDVLVGPAAVAGIPALSVPAGKTAAGLPVGVQIMGPRLSEALVMSVGHQLSFY
ncbi:MAG: Asp-tRNA(Asn)/Glu-tRNA(Gln) amidotransferase subunit GatA [Candidatus Magasanikbacteria bacterium]|nr:Asp-tRNA(Asn)/Glu-tRNA(Gln) amidotransferase subunit GatA [Candidatus Magasanikbacteria bacterium]